MSPGTNICHLPNGRAGLAVLNRSGGKWRSPYGHQNGHSFNAPEIRFLVRRNRGSSGSSRVRSVVVCDCPNPAWIGVKGPRSVKLQPSSACLGREQSMEALQSVHQHWHQHVRHCQHRQCHEADSKDAGGYRDAIVQHIDDSCHSEAAETDRHHDAPPVAEAPQTQRMSVPAKLHW